MCTHERVGTLSPPQNPPEKSATGFRTTRGLHGHARVHEREQRLVTGIIIGYYDRDGFKDSELLAKSYGLAPPSPRLLTTPSSTTTRKADGKLIDDADNVDDSVEENDAQLETSSSDTRKDCTAPPLLRMGGIGGGGIQDWGAGHGNVRIIPMASRRSRRKERQLEHQESILRKQEERRSVRRRFQIEKERRARDIVRRRSEAAAYKKARLLHEAQEAANFAPVVERVLRGLQRKTATVVATVIGLVPRVTRL